jgi:hypothetical protein
MEHRLGYGGGTSPRIRAPPAYLHTVFKIPWLTRPTSALKSCYNVVVREFILSWIYSIYKECLWELNEPSVTDWPTMIF